MTRLEVVLFSVAIGATCYTAERQPAYLLGLLVFTIGKFARSFASVIH